MNVVQAAMNSGPAGSHATSYSEIVSIGSNQRLEGPNMLLPKEQSNLEEQERAKSLLKDERVTQIIGEMRNAL